MQLLNEMLEDAFRVARREYQSAVRSRNNNINELIKLKLNCNRTEFQIKAVQN
jgi:hypothetical protein